MGRRTFARPNGSGKTTITKLAKVIEPYINADDIKRTVHRSDLDAAYFFWENEYWSKDRVEHLIGIEFDEATLCK